MRPPEIGNSRYYRSLGMPWGGLFAPAREVLRFLQRVWHLLSLAELLRHLRQLLTELRLLAGQLLIAPGARLVAA